MSDAATRSVPSVAELFRLDAPFFLIAGPCVLKAGTRAAEAYGATEISERHRHRYEVNNNYRDALERHGMVLSGLSPDSRLVEMIELPQHPWFVACQFHPEFKSRPWAPQPLFARFVKASCEHAGQTR